MIGICWFCHLLIDKNATSRTSPTELGKAFRLCRKCPRSCDWKKNACQKCGKSQKYGILTKYELTVTSFSSIGMVLVLKVREPGFKSSRCNKCLYYMFLWLNCSIRKLFFVSIIRRRTSWLLSYHMEGRPYWQRVKFTGVSAVSVFNI